MVGMGVDVEELNPEILFDVAGHGASEVGEEQACTAVEPDTLLLGEIGGEVHVVRRVVESQAQSAEQVKWRKEKLVATLDLGGWGYSQKNWESCRICCRSTMKCFPWRRMGVTGMHCSGTRHTPVG